MSKNIEANRLDYWGRPYEKDQDQAGEVVSGLQCKIAYLQGVNDRLTQDLQHCQDAWYTCSKNLLKARDKTEELYRKLADHEGERGADEG